MNISIIGAGYVGLVTGACLAESGFHVLCMDSDKEKIHRLENGILPIFEPGLPEALSKGRQAGSIRYSSSTRDAVGFSTILLLCVNTPTLEDYSCDLQYVLGAAREIAAHMEDYKVIVTKSTVPVGTGRQVKEEILRILEQKHQELPFDVVSNPEFLREGTAMQDFMKPDRIIIGSENEKAEEIVKSMYGTQIQKGVPVIATHLETAEMIKYAANTFLATKISFINEIANLCELCGADVSVVSRAMGLDGRIGPKFLSAGPGFGGSCLPKDTKALVGIGKTLGYPPKIVQSVIEVNESQKARMAGKIETALGGLQDRTVTLLGLSFKPETDDIRESPAIPMIQALLCHGAAVKVTDPQAIGNMQRSYPDLPVAYHADVYKACEDSDCIVLLTEWPEYCRLDLSRLKSLVRTSVFVDLRNMYQPDDVRKSGFSYIGVGRK